MSERQWRSLYDRVAPVLVVFCLLSSLFASVGVYMTNRHAARETVARQEYQAKLLNCFDDYAAAASESSVAVREASVRKDEATSVRDDALAVEGEAFQTVVEHILAGDLEPAQVKHLADTLEARAHAARLLDQAQTALDKARRENPVPKPPSQFCNVQP